MAVSQSDLTSAILAPDADIPKGISDGAGNTAGKRFDVYRNNVAVSLTEALVTAFPTVHSLVGDQFFRALAGVYLRQHPPSSPLMMFYGAQMPSFLQGFEPAKGLPYLPDVARIDLALRQAYHAADSTAITAEALQIAPDALMSARMDFAPATQIIHSPYPIFGIWNLARGGPKPPAEAQDVLISRPGFDPEIDLLPKGGAAFLEALLAEETFESALDTAALDPATELGPLLGLALQRGIFTRLH